VGNAGGGVFGECGAGTRCGSSGVTLTSSTVSGNTAGKDGGGIFNDAFHQSIVTFINSTVSGNTAGSGYSGGGVLSDGTTGNEVTLVSSILAGNVAGGTANDCEMSSGSATASYSLIQASAKACGVTDGASNNRVGVNLRLAVLADNGCATLAGTACVQTHALQAGSLALDTGSNPNDLITDNGVMAIRVRGVMASIWVPSRGRVTLVRNRQPLAIAVLISRAVIQLSYDPPCLSWLGSLWIPD